MFFLLLTAKLQGTSFHFGYSENGWNPGCRISFKIVNHWNISFLEYLQPTIFPPHIPNKKFVVVNSSKSDSPGTYWIVLCISGMFLTLLIPLVYFFGSTPICINDWTRLFIRSLNWWRSFSTRLNFQNVQFFCIYLAHLTYDKNFNGDSFDFIYINDHVLKRFLSHMLFHQLTI